MKAPRRSSKNTEQRAGMPPSRLRRVTDYIHSHLEEPLSLKQMAELAQMSPYHFGRLFKQSTGMTPHKYVLGEKIWLAKGLLTDGFLSITEVSVRCGFSSHSHFTTAFRKWVGMTPREYRLEKIK
jgi:AraC family transcriptional regulator